MMGWLTWARAHAPLFSAVFAGVSLTLRLLGYPIPDALTGILVSVFGLTLADRQVSTNKSVLRTEKGMRSMRGFYGKGK